MWQPNEEASHCNNSSCAVRFSILTRRHHCRICGLVGNCVDCSPVPVDNCFDVPSLADFVNLPHLAEPSALDSRLHI
jgi:hypothetical protein